ncbi:hypothetical protein ABU614_08015 [Lysobacter firmicutimachus]|uniref:Uncharacterized protein n=1 Tax=Lysobacter firmicutimachus TaxID=1792846 RepID=A0AAU8MZQ6_9GAMM
MKGLIVVLAALLCSACAPTLVDGWPGSELAAAAGNAREAAVAAAPVPASVPAPRMPRPARG